MQDPAYLAAHGIMQQQEKRIAELEAQVGELQGDVSRLTIENEQLKERLSAPAIQGGISEFTGIAMQPYTPDEKPVKKSRTK